MDDVAAIRTNDELVEEELCTDPAFRAEWERTAPARGGDRAGLLPSRARSLAA